LLQRVSCSCGEGNSDKNPCIQQFYSFGGTTAGFASMCEGIEASHTFPDMTISVSSDFMVDDPRSHCAVFSVEDIPYSIFQFRQRRVLKTLAINSETTILSAESIFILNREDTIAGQILSDGYAFKFQNEYELSGVEACINVSLSGLNEWKLRQELANLDLVSSESPYKHFYPIGLKLSLHDTIACIPVTGRKNVTYFVAGLVDQWESLEPQYTWTSAEVGLLIFVAVAYLLLLLW